MDIDTLVRDYTPMLMGYALRFLGDRMAAEEVVQDAFVAAWRKPERIGQARNVRSYLLGIAHNRAVDYVRHHYKRRQFEIPWENARLRTTTIPDQSHQELLLDAIARLSPPYRVCVELRLTGALYHEIADYLHIPMGTVRSRLNYARQRVRTLQAQWEKVA